LIETQQLLDCADYVNLLDKNINTVNNTESLLDTCKEVGLNVNTEKTKYVLMSQHQKAR
jgi:hypothetical protein